MSGIMNMLLGARTAIAAAVDEFFNLTTLLLPGDGTNGAQNNTFLDSSTNNFTITRNGNTTQGTFSPFSQTGWSNYFDGTDDYLSVADNAVLRPGAGAFTLEAWIYRGAAGAAHTIYAKGGASTGIVFQVTSGNVLRFTHTTTNIDSTGTISANTWTHVVVVREGTGTNQTKLYINGTQDGQGTVSTDFTQTEEVRIGTNRGATEDFNGYISNLRFTKGAALYTGNFTPSTSPLTTTSQGASATDVELLTCQSNRFVDNSSNGFSITVNNNASVQAFSPFLPTIPYSAATVGGSGYFDASGDYLTATQSAFIATGDFTCEAWYYQINQTSGFQGIVSTAAAGGTTGIRITTDSGTLTIWLNNSSVTVASAPQNQWNHVAISRTGTGSNNVSCYLNGTRVGQLTNTGSTTNSSLTVGRYYYDTADYYINGYISNVRLVVGSGLYSGATITVPTAPFTAVTNTQLLLNFTNAGITDATAKNVLETLGNAQISTTQSKFGGSSVYFDGTGDYLDIPSTINAQFGTGDFTVEGWLYLNSLAATQVLFEFRAASGASYGQVYITTGGVLRFYLPTDVGTSNTLSTGAWTHFAITRASGTLNMYIGGTRGYSATYTTAMDATRFRIGADVNGANGVNGYIDDLRFTKGFARYTGSTLTVPTAAFALQ
jgi:hypothetical protein